LTSSVFVPYEDLFDLSDTPHARQSINLWYAALDAPTIKKRACLPGSLVSETQWRTFQPEAMSYTTGAKAESQTDNVAFLMSYSEAITYWPTNALRILRDKQGTSVNWYLRSPGDPAESRHAALVQATNGAITTGSMVVSRHLRPALWIK
jgi:type V secretory pathway adhesin AidA